MAAKKSKGLTPREARTFHQICDLPRDNVSLGDHWMMVNEGLITICQQKVGEHPTGSVSIPRWKLERFIDWYNDGQWGRKRR